MKNREEVESKGGPKTVFSMSINRQEPTKPPWRVCADQYLLFSVVKSKHLSSSVFKCAYLVALGVHVLAYSQHASEIKSCRRRPLSTLSLTLC